MTGLRSWFPESPRVGTSWLAPHPDHPVFNTLPMSDTPEPPHDAYPESWETFWTEDDEGNRVANGRTDDGKEFALDAGSPDRVEGRCNAPLRDYERRYGEIRYCTQLPAKKFPGYDSEYCKTHISMEYLEERAHELFKHGYFAETYVHFASHLSPPKFLFAVEMLGGLFEMSDYGFEIEEEPVLIDTSDSDLIYEDVIEVSLPVPSTTKYLFQADQLWQGALAEVEMRNMREVVFNEGLSKDTYAQTADVDGEITDTLTEQTEHHLHLPISRLTKDIKEHLKNGGVEVGSDDESGTLTLQKNDYTLDITPEEEMEPDDAQSVSEVSEDFSEKLEAEDGQTVIEVD